MLTGMSRHYSRHVTTWLIEQTNNRFCHKPVQMSLAELARIIRASRKSISLTRVCCVAAGNRQGLAWALYNAALDLAPINVERYNDFSYSTIHQAISINIEC